MNKEKLDPRLEQAVRRLESIKSDETLPVVISFQAGITDIDIGRVAKQLNKMGVNPLVTATPVSKYIEAELGLEQLAKVTHIDCVKLIRLQSTDYVAL